MSKDINEKPFTEETLLKLDLFRECFREWFPVFINVPSVKKLFVCDLFAGSGTDVQGNPGSPLILLQEARGNQNQFCSQLSGNNQPKVFFAFNELESAKCEKLKKAVEREMSSCKSTCTVSICPFKQNIHFREYEFSRIIQNENFAKIMRNESFAKFLLLDQYGFKEINEEIFKKLISFPKTDFVFFVASSNVKRFVTTDAVQRYLQLEKRTYDESKPNECHRVLVDYFRSLIPDDKEYYLHGFTIQKGSNYWGVVFGSSHSFGMEKFLRVCWKHDTYAGESNCNIHNDYKYGPLFTGESTHHKLDAVKREIRESILSSKIVSNKQGLIYALKRGCLPKVYVDVITELKNEQLVSISGTFNKAWHKIHSVKEYRVEVVK